MRNIIAAGIGFLKKHTNLRFVAVKIIYTLSRLRYRLIYGKNKVDDYIIVFEAYMGRQYACSPKAIYEELRKDKRFENYKFVWMFVDPTKVKDVDELRNATIVEYGSKIAYEYYSKAKYVISNSNIKYDVIPKSNQVFVQTWHGTPLKRLRCDIEVENGNDMNTLKEIHYKNDQDIKRYSFFLSPSNFSTEKFTTAFRLKELGKEDIIIEEGYPRNDFLYNYTNENYDRIKGKLGIDKNDLRKVILYAPTFRDNLHEAGKGYVYDQKMDFDLLKEKISNNYIILFRAHYFISNTFDFDKYDGFIKNVSNIDDINELYIVTDVLITDYSSVIFDYANLKKPMLLYMYDLDEYSDNIRGFYTNINSVPGTIVKTQEELIEQLIKGVELPEEKYSLFNKKYNYLEDGSASKRVVNRIFRKGN